MVTRRKRKSTSLKGLGVKFGATVRKRYGVCTESSRSTESAPHVALRDFLGLHLGYGIVRNVILK